MTTFYLQLLEVHQNSSSFSLKMSKKCIKTINSFPFKVMIRKSRRELFKINTRNCSETNMKPVLTDLWLKRKQNALRVGKQLVAWCRGVMCKAAKRLIWWISGVCVWFKLGSLLRTVQQKSQCRRRTNEWSQTLSARNCMHE